MKKRIEYILIAMVMMVIPSCDQNFDDWNTNRVDATSINPAFQLNQAIINSSASSFGTMVYELGIVQQLISPNSGVLTGANYNQDNRASTQNNWQVYYREVIKNTKDIISRIKDDPTRSDLYQMTRILQANAFLVLTDTYGSIPYTEAGAGFSDQVFFPVYDTQEFIYDQIIRELTEAGNALGAAGSNNETAEILYRGNIDQWRKFANSLLLRAGMRLSRVDPSRAQQIAQTAFSNGVILENEDNAVIRHDNNFLNPIGNTLNATEASNVFMTEPFVNYLRENNDPRLRAIAVRYVGAGSGSAQTVDRQTFDPDLQIGMPMGLDNATAVQRAASMGLVSFYEFSQIDRRRIAKLNAPNFIVTASQTNLLLAEAASRGWISGDAAEFYSNGIRLHMEQLASYDPLSEIPEEDIAAYIASNPLNSQNALEEINTQYWVSSLMNGPEAFANFRRSGYPDLEPNPYPGREVVFINRLTYPNSEISVNSENVQQAISQQGPDNLETRVWWHTP
ncbi:SusD/RagB family nutrient-binding outer membrane lipoprotein [Arthrospiribacter ruber]|uniref:SusD/RagB family nutrient-binding outer membrane lipoprotein n=1 Tax=Arthrospiribacter ruber TaxID=2487934 RepID=A0A951J1G7_9BACT|nr:SusD/RagB family nutrient-binding outer membrane lipoprotein [Arthrospiribacter ruber]MBW3469502.1 SusD/RagB family nutrient-binding outer membrane lipoprotein [Arthrospiribacter ruber]